uniref:Inhibitor of growth protein n=1 Tax=Anopheles marajoara TaxID=58244 RepID=A0A2M4BDI2_9DIPT
MLYLEDYLEMIEHLPQELRDRFTEMREMDLAVQNNSDTLAKRAKVLFTQCRHNEVSTAEADAEFANIRNEYYRVLEDADEKVQLAGQMYDLVDRYLRRLDTELYKFKCELEADHNGITEILEKRSLELDNTTSNGNTIQKENRFYDAHGPFTPSSTNRVESRHKVKSEKRRNSHALSGFSSFEKRIAGSSTPLSIGSSSAMSNTTSATTAPHVLSPSTGGSVTYNLQTFGAGNAIAAAASQAIAQTQQMQQGRRTASLKASYEAIGAAGSHELLINSELAGATHNAIQAVERESSSFSNQRRQKKKTPGNNSVSTGALPMQQPVNPQPAALHQPTSLLPQQQQSIQLEQASTQHQQQLLPTHQHQSQPATNVSTIPSAVGSTVQLQVQQHSKGTSHNMQLPHSAQMQQMSLQPQQLQKTPPLSQGQLQQQTPQLQQQQLKQQPRNLSQQQQLAQPHTVGQSTQSVQQLPQIRKIPYVLGTSMAKMRQLRHEMEQHQFKNQKHLKLIPVESESSSLLPQQQSQLSAQQVPNPPQQHLHVQLAQPHIKLQQKPHKQQPIQFQAQQQQQQQTSNLLSVQSSLTQTQQHVPQMIHQVQQTSQHQMQPISNQQHVPITQHHLKVLNESQTHLNALKESQKRTLQQQEQQRMVATSIPTPLQTQQFVKKQEQQLQQQHKNQHVIQPQSQDRTSSSYQSQQQSQSHLLQSQTQQLAMQQQQSVQIGQNLQQQQQHAQIVQPQQQQVVQPSHPASSTAYSQMQPSPQLQHQQAVGQTSIHGQQTSGLSPMSSIDSLSTLGIEPSPSLESMDSGAVMETEGEWSYDPNEPRYCICNQVSYGDMVACDNEGCPFEWFHYPCVNITSSPKGKWYCPQCSTSMKRRGSRKN